MFKELPIAGEFAEMLLHQNLGTSTSIKPKKKFEDFDFAKFLPRD